MKSSTILRILFGVSVAMAIFGYEQDEKTPFSRITGGKLIVFKPGPGDSITVEGLSLSKSDYECNEVR